MMANIFVILAIGLIALAILLLGVVIGIKDCKRIFRIPKGAVGVDDDGYIYS